MLIDCLSNGLSILCCSITKEDAEIKLFSHDTPEPLAHINPGIEGFTHAAFLNNTGIAIWSDVGLRVTIWTIKDKTCKPLVNVPWPKKGWAIHQQRYLALLRRVDGQDVVSIYDGKSDWQQASVSVSNPLLHISFLCSLSTCIRPMQPIFHTHLVVAT